MTETLRRAGFGNRTTTVDVLVVGGGITGAAVAYEAASRGLSVALVESGDYGGATSAATGKLIHGGLRYLKQLDVRLVRESLAERRTLMAIAPHLVEPVAMVLPDPGLVERLGLTAYDALSFDRNRIHDPRKHIPRHRVLDADELAARGLPFLSSGALFHDAMMPAPERLTLAFVRSAAHAGAAVAHHVSVEELLGQGGQVVGARVRDRLDDTVGEIRSRCVVNATGPWSHDLLAASDVTRPVAGPAPEVRSEGIYLVTRQLSETMVLTVSGHSHFSFAPWRGHSLVGPTETPYRGPVSQWRLTLAAVEQFVEHINASSSAPVRLSLDDVSAAYGGLRPLTDQSGDDTYRASRASELVDHGPDGVRGIVSATGGKYTSSRAFAQKTVQHVVRQHRLAARPSSSARTYLVGCGPTVEAPDVVDRVYGTDAPSVRALAAGDARLARPASADGVPFAAVVHSARHESVTHLSDLLLRRTTIGTLGDPGDAVLAEAAELAGAELDWDAERIRAEIDDARRTVRLPTT